MPTIKIKDFFNGRFFEIPKYQRGYAWEINNVRELFDDIIESIESQSNHYLGTIVLSENDEDDEHYYIVDGQQRIATISMILSQLILSLKKNDTEFYKRFYLYDEKYRLTPLGKDKKFFIEILENNSEEPKNKSQRLMLNAISEIRNRVEQVGNKLQFLKSIEKLEVMEFVESCEGDAIRIFQTVNDRGKPLSNMEKAKSLLVYFSNRYLNKQLDSKINHYFGEIFEIYDNIKHIGEELGINLIKGKEFNEDNIMRYHFITFSDENYDATAPYVLNFLKTNLDNLRKNSPEDDYSEIEDFIKAYTESLYNFFKSLEAIIQRTKTDEYYYKLFVILGISATLYPLLTKLEIIELLDENLPGEDYEEFTFLTLIELIDVRVYKTRGTDPRAQISKFTYELDQNMDHEKILDWLLWFNQAWMSEQELKSTLNGYIYGNRALPYIFLTYCEDLIGKEFNLKKLIDITNKKPTIEHILSQTPIFSYRSHGFRNEEDFIEFDNTIGNLTLLEKSINSAVQNKNAIEKVPYYDKSKFKMTRKLSSKISSEGSFKKADIKTRTEDLIKYITETWWVE